jgi:hypothetical protein
LEGDSILLAVALGSQTHYPAKRDIVGLSITREPYFSIEPFDDCINAAQRARILEELMIYPTHQSRLCTDPETPITGPKEGLDPEGRGLIS